MLSELLLLHGFKITRARTPAEAIHMVEKNHLVFDALLSDVMMPGMNGTELGDRLRLTLPGLRVVYVSGYAEEDVMRNIKLDSDTVFMQKNTSPSALVETLRGFSNPPFKQ